MTSYKTSRISVAGRDLEMAPSNSILPREKARHTRGTPFPFPDGWTELTLSLRPHARDSWGHGRAQMLQLPGPSTSFQNSCGVILGLSSDSLSANGLMTTPQLSGRTRKTLQDGISDPAPTVNSAKLVLGSQHRQPLQRQTCRWMVCP